MLYRKDMLMVQMGTIISVFAQAWQDESCRCTRMPRNHAACLDKDHASVWQQFLTSLGSESVFT